MQFSFAPMEGVSGFVIRNALAKNFNNIDKFYTPFIPVQARLNNQIIRDISPENNQGIHLIPQLISNKAEEVIFMQKILSEYGYREVNINLGCPSGTVVTKKRGSGLLLYPEELDQFLYELYEKADFPISIKTRIGFNEVSEWDRLLDIYAKYPMSEFIIHPRIRKDIYRNLPRMEEFQKAVQLFQGKDIPLVYNGDIVDQQSYQEMTMLFPSINHVMIGRGLMANPALCEELATQKSPDKKQRLRAFHDDVFQGYQDTIQGEKDVLMHMKQLWTWMINSFEDADKMAKKIKKSQSKQEYLILVDQLFENYKITDAFA